MAQYIKVRTQELEITGEDDPRFQTAFTRSGHDIDVTTSCFLHRQVAKNVVWSSETEPDSSSVLKEESTYGMSTPLWCPQSDDHLVVVCETVKQFIASCGEVRKKKDHNPYIASRYKSN